MNAKHRLTHLLGRGPAGRAALAALAPFVRDGRLAILTYHRIAATAEAVASMTPGLVSAVARDFDEHLRFVRSRFALIGMDDLLSLRHGERTASRRPLVMVTFDDAYRDFLDVAWPSISALGIPATVFVATAFPDEEAAYWWDQLAFSMRTTAEPAVQWDGTRLPLGSADDRRLAARHIHDDLQRLPTDQAIVQLMELVERLGTGQAPAEVLSWREIADLAASGATIGGHSHAHHRLDRMHPDALRSDLERCRAILTERLGSPPRAFAYPTGYHSEDVAAAVEAAGFEIAFTTQRGVADPCRVDWFRVPRINVGLRSNPALLGLQTMLLRPRRSGI